MQSTAVVNFELYHEFQRLVCLLFFPKFHQPSSTVSKPNAEGETTEPEEPNLLERMIETLHMELLFVRHRIAVKLSNLGQGTTVEISLKLLC